MKVIIQITFLKNGNEITGYLTQNKSGIYYPTSDRSVIFGSLIDAISALNSITNEYDIKKVSYLNLNDRPVHVINTNIDLRTASDVIQSLIEYRFNVKSVDVTLSDGNILVSWDGNVLNYGKTIYFNPSYVNFESDNIQLNYDEKLIKDIIIILNSLNSGCDISKLKLN